MRLYLESNPKTILFFWKLLWKIDEIYSLDHKITNKRKFIELLFFFYNFYNKKKRLIIEHHWKNMI